MLGNLKNPPEPFSDIIRTHFRLKARSIKTQLDDWLRKDDGKSTQSDGAYNSEAGGGSGNAFQKDVDEMKAILTQLEAGKS
jgi:hypothetical protein